MTQIDDQSRDTIVNLISGLDSDNGYTCLGAGVRQALAVRKFR
jgi:hypothetical protein